MVKGVAVELHGDDLLNSRASSTKRFLQTFENALAILMRELQDGVI
jgi:Flp pilus assembly protein TadB